MNPLVTNRAFHLSILSSALYLMINNHLQPIGFLPCGSSVILQVLFFSNVFISTLTTFDHFGLFHASWIVVGICMLSRVDTKTWYDGDSLS